MQTKTLQTGGVDARSHNVERERTRIRRSESANFLQNFRVTHGIRFYLGCGYQMHLVRPIRDLDCFICQYDFFQLRQKAPGELVTLESGDVCYQVDLDIPIEFVINSWPRGFSYDDFEPHLPPPARPLVPSIIPGVMAWSIDTTVLWKQQAGRPKDREDLCLLRGD